MSQKYGKRLLAHKIEHEEFEIIRTELINNLNADLSIHYDVKIDKNNKIEHDISNLLEKCFKLDTNETPNFYHLLPISSIIVDYASSNPQLKEHASKFWSLVENKIAELFRQGAKSAFEKQLLSQDQYDRYFVSSKDYIVKELIFCYDCP